MRTLLFIFFWVAWGSSALAEVSFKGLGASTIPWDKLTPDEFLDFSEWKRALARREKRPHWKRHRIEREMREMMGRVLQCVGICRVYRGEGFSHGRYRSALREGDEIVTMEDSYLWVYFFEGTLLRLSPNSSVSLREFNVGVEENFLHLRLDSGNILWLSRGRQKFQVREHQETDAVFLPLDYREANFPQGEVVIDEDNLFSLIEEVSSAKVQYQRLNRLIEENNESIFKKPTTSYLVFHNGTVWGKDLSAEFIILFGGRSYFKLRDGEQLKWSEGGEFSTASFAFRGFENRDEKKLESGKWYQVGERGRELKEFYGDQRFAIGEFLTSNMPTIYLARELMAKKYSLFAHQNLNVQKLAMDFGYRQWTSKDLEQRLQFLKEYTRRSETRGLLVREQFHRKLEKEGENLKKYFYGPHFYRKAMNDYYTFRDRGGR